MTFVIQYSKNAKFVSKSLDVLEEKDANRFKLLLAMKAKELKRPNKTYSIKTDG